MDMRRLVVMSFSIKFIIACFFLTLLSMHYLVSQVLFNRTASLESVRDMLDRGADVNARSTSTYEKLSGLTPLMEAVSWNDLPRVELLLKPKYKANVNLRADNRQGDTILIMAIRSPSYGEIEKAKKIKIINLLLDRGANVHDKNNYGDTPFIAVLDVSELDMRKKVAEILIARGADLNAQNRQGDTNLHLAIQRGYSDWIAWLLPKYGSRINLNLKNKDEYTLWELAQRLKNIPVTDAVRAGISAVLQQQKKK